MTRPITPGVVMKMRVPIGIREHSVGRAFGSVFICGVKEAAKVWVDLQCVKVISAGLLEPYAGRIVPGIEAGLCDVVSHQVVEAAAAIAQIKIVGI